MTADGTIAVFQGIPGAIAGFELSTVDLLSDTKIEDLTPVAQEKVKEGIPSDSQEAAREQMENLLDPASKNVLPLCPAPLPTATVTSPSPGASASASAGAVTPTPTGDVAPLPSGYPDCRPIN